MRARWSFLIFAVSAILGIVALQALHLRYKPATLESAFYDPTFVYALKETPEALARESCQPNTVMAFGSSPLDTALARRGTDWSRREKWRRYDGPLDDSQRLFVIVRTRQADLRLFDPLLSQLPNCKKVVVVSAGTLLPERPKKEGAIKKLKTRLFDGPVYYYSTLVESFWPPSYRINSRKTLDRITREKKAFLKANFEHAYRQRGEFRAIHAAHRDIILALVENNAQVVILDMDRSREWENGGATEQESFRRVLQAFAETDEAIHYRHFSSLDAQYYLDQAHLNYKGADIFRPWLAAETAEIARGTDGFQ